MNQKESATKIRIRVSRHGNNLFADGLYGHQGSVHLVASLKPKDLIVEEGGRVYLKVKDMECTRKISKNRPILISLIRKKNRKEIAWTIMYGNHKNIVFDPWDCV